MAEAYLKVPLPKALAARMARNFDRRKWYQYNNEIIEHCRSIPEYRALAIEQRVEGFDFACQHPWACIGVNFLVDPDDDTRALLILKFDMSKSQHYLSQPSGRWG